MKKLLREDLLFSGVSGAIDYPELDKLSYKRNPAPDGHRSN